MFHDLKSKCTGSDEQSTSASNEGEGDQEDTPFTDNYDIATSHFKNIVDEHVETDKEITGGRMKFFPNLNNVSIKAE